MNGQHPTSWIPLEEILSQPKPDRIRTRLKTEGVDRYERMAAASGAFDIAADKVLDIITPPTPAEQEEWDRLHVGDRFE